MNTKHRNIKFTFQHKHNTFSFLDVKICCENNKSTTSVYRKLTFSGVFTNFKYFLPTVQKFGYFTPYFIITLIYEKFHNKIMKFINKFLKLINGYPVQFSQKLYVTKAIQDTVNKKQLLIVLLFLGAQSFLVTKGLPSCIRNHLPYCSLRTVFQSNTRLSSLFCFKDIIPKAHT